MSRSHRFEASDGVALRYAETGPAEGTAVVLCHGLAAGGAQFSADAEALGGRGFRVLVPDLRGHGASESPTDRNEGFAIARMAADALAMLDHAGAGAVHWVGNSLGGIIALHLMAAAPERLRSVVFFGTAFSLSLPVGVAATIPLLYRLVGAERLAAIGGRMTTGAPEGREQVRRLLQAFDPEAGRAIARHVRRYDMIENARNYRGPMLMIRGGRDHGVNRALGPTLRAMQGHERFTLVEMPRCGHCANLDAPEAVREALLAFWAEAARAETGAGSGSGPRP